jgi:histidyl-tRNA synthetase
MKGLDVYFGEEDKLREYVILKLSKFFKQYSYNKISIPSLEQQTIFSSEMVGSHPWPSWHPKSLFPVIVKDYNKSYEGNPFVSYNCFLVPEVTATVCRWVAGKMKEKDFALNIGQQLRTFYVTNCFRNELIDKISDTKLRQFTQIGIENMGDNSYKSDIEVLYMAFESLRQLDLSEKEIRIRISDVRIFNYFCKFYKLDLNQQYVIKDLVDKISNKKSSNSKELKDLIAALNSKAIDYNLNNPKFPASIFYTKYQNNNVLLKKLENYPKEISENLQQIIDTASYLGFEITLDFSVIRSQEYYSGLTFQIDLLIDKVIISEVGGGGRYDYFLKRIMELENISHNGTPSVGFALSLERIIKALKTKNLKANTSILYPISQNIDVILVSQDIKKLIGISKKLTMNGLIVLLHYINTDKKKINELSKMYNSQTIII